MSKTIPSNETTSRPFVFIQLNLWDGRLFYPIKNFLDREQPDIFSAQEVLTGPIDISPSYMTAEALIKNGYFQSLTSGHAKERLVIKSQMFELTCATFLKQSSACHFSKHIIFSRRQGIDDPYHSLLHSQIILDDGASVHIINHHARLVFEGRMGSPATEEDFRQIADYIATLSGPIIFSGDFNLFADSSPLQYIKALGLKNLNEIYGLTKSRNEFAWQPDECVSHLFVNDQVIVEEYAILTDNVSDHLPLRLKCRVLKSTG